MGMTWKQIMKYEPIINKISYKYSGDTELAKDVTQEVILKLFEDDTLDIRTFAPTTRDAAIRNTIRNKVIKVLNSKKIGRWPHDSLDKLEEMGYQVDLNGNIVSPMRDSDMDEPIADEKIDSLDSANYIMDNDNPDSDK